jgi:hypothetical protein
MSRVSQRALSNAGRKPYDQIRALRITTTKRDLFGAWHLTDGCTSHIPESAARRNPG